MKDKDKEYLKDKDKELYDELNKICLQDYIDKRLKRTQELSKKQFNIIKGKQNFKDELKDEDIMDYIQVSHYGKEPIENKVLASRAKVYVFSI